MYKKILAWSAVLFSLLAAASASAGPATDRVKAKQAQLFKVIAEPKSDEQHKKLRDLFDEMIAYEMFAQSSLGDKWAERSDAEKQRFTDLLTELVRANYKKNIKKLLEFNVSYSAEATKDDVTTVTTVNKHKTRTDEPELEVEFKLKAIGGKLKIVDIVTERASMVKTFRSQFLKVLKEKDFEALIAKMEKKLKKLNKKLDTQG